MKKISAACAFLLLFESMLIADGRSFRAEGGNLYPLEETRIELKKEILSVKKAENGWIRVDVYFEFYNPDSSRTLTVGFVTPSASGLVDIEDYMHPQIKGFSVMFNDEPLPYDIYKVNDPDPKVNEIIEIREKPEHRKIVYEDTSHHFVFCFNANFNKGLNTIRHSYYYAGAHDGEGDDFSYVITTGKSWANAEIEDFELNIDMGTGIFYVNDTFWKTNENIDWKIAGAGRIFPAAETLYLEDAKESGNIKKRSIYIRSGYLTCHLKNFKPDWDIKFGIEYGKTSTGYELKDNQSVWKALYVFDEYIIQPYYSKESINEDLGECSKEDLRLLRALILAFRGYVFKDEATQEIFDSFTWYLPNYSLKEEDIMFTNKEKVLLKMIKDTELKK